jgi:hypothetical protein
LRAVAVIPGVFAIRAELAIYPGDALVLSYFRQLVVGKIGESVQTQWHEHGSSGGGEAPGG